MPRLIFNSKADYRLSYAHELNALTHYFCPQWASYLWRQFDISFSGGFCFSRFKITADRDVTTRYRCPNPIDDEQVPQGFSSQSVC
jgi:hypothetical protein